MAANDRKPGIQDGKGVPDEPMDRASSGGGANEGEGNRSADRHYRDGVTRTVKSGQVEKKAREAERALDSVYGDELRRAEKLGKQHSHGEDPALKKKT